ncbi:Hypothetical predicted protein [Pelobates cultripes]|uniref:Reverse transcriptase n=1 Tax=Pelobates cultripes TaxID=61616 RepID=A0AAD1RF72_PELCU|nr:Hypothetical predicted protein [Pelobates cultripes]
MTKDATKAIQWTKQTYYEKSNKADTLLARKLQRRTNHKRIDVIQTPDGTKHSTPTKIGEVFQKYFSTLYDHSPNLRQHPEDTKQTIDTYLRQIPLPALKTEAISKISEPITIEEIAKAIKNTKPNKSPGPDGFTRHSQPHSSHTSAICSIQYCRETPYLPTY